MIANLTHLSYCRNARPPGFVKVLLALRVASCKHISIHVYQALTLFSYLLYMEDSSKGSAKEAPLLTLIESNNVVKAVSPCNAFLSS